MYPEHVNGECSLEVLEGLAEYTGRRLTFPSDRAFLRSMSDLDRFYTSDNLTRSFAYLSGPLYGLILDQSGHRWQKEMTAASDLGSFVRDIYGIELPENLEKACETARLEYDFASIDDVEEAFDRLREERDAEIRRLFATDNVISLPCASLSIQFPPDGMIQMEDGSMVIYGGEAYCDWGYAVGHPLKVAGDWRHIELPRLDTLSVQGDTVITSGWTLVKKD